MKRASALVLAAAAFCVAAGALTSADTQAVDRSHSAMQPYIERYFADRGLLDRYWDDVSGAGRFGGPGRRGGADPTLPGHVARVRQFDQEWMKTMFFWRMHRCARIIFSLGYHLGTMTPEQAVDFLVDRVGHERANAEGEVRRSFNGSYAPLYQCAYMLGALQFRALPRELVVPKTMTARAFHDAILQENRIPVELIRADLAKVPLTRDFETSWKFYGEIPK